MLGRITVISKIVCLLLLLFNVQNSYSKDNFITFYYTNGVSVNSIDAELSLGAIKESIPEIKRISLLYNMSGSHFTMNVLDVNKRDDILEVFIQKYEEDKYIKEIEGIKNSDFKKRND